VSDRAWRLAVRRASCAEPRVRPTDPLIARARLRADAGLERTERVSEVRARARAYRAMRFKSMGCGLSDASARSARYAAWLADRATGGRWRPSPTSRPFRGGRQAADPTPRPNGMRHGSFADHLQRLHNNDIMAQSGCVLEPQWRRRRLLFDGNNHSLGGFTLRSRVNEPRSRFTAIEERSPSLWTRAIVDELKH